LMTFKSIFHKALNLLWNQAWIVPGTNQYLKPLLNFMLMLQWKQVL